MAVAKDFAKTGMRICWSSRFGSRRKHALYLVPQTPGTGEASSTAMVPKAATKRPAPPNVRQQPRNRATQPDSQAIGVPVRRQILQPARLSKEME